MLACAYMRGGTLKEALKAGNHGRLKWHARWVQLPGWRRCVGQARLLLIWVSIFGFRGRQVAIDVAEAVVHLHSLSVVHSDLKSR